MKILILCTGNSCRSQMAEGFLKSFDPSLEVYSAGTQPTARVNPFAIRVMSEAGLDISVNQPRNVDEFLSMEFDYVITVCDGARESCPMFTGKVKHRLHIGFEDPADAEGSEDEVLAKFRQVRDKISSRFKSFYESIGTAPGCDCGGPGSSCC